ncbi:MAG TPA: hypothetical protein VKW06_18980 [Candidatus Angelobacter sp.]|nr:hypothetical protein [Candidatus Angelobacter sp.]
MQEVLPPKFKEYQDDWGTTAREGYEDRGPARPVKAYQGGRGSALKTVGGLAIVGGIFWTTYLLTQSPNWRDVVGVLEQNHGPVAIIGLGAVSSLLGKYLRV